MTVAESWTGSVGQLLLDGSEVLPADRCEQMVVSEHPRRGFRDDRQHERWRARASFGLFTIARSCTVHEPVT